MSKVKKICETNEISGALKKHCYYELEEVDADELFEQLKDAVDNGLDEIPNTFTFVHIECLDKECWDTIKMEFNINPYDYLDENDIKELEEMIDKRNN